MQTKHVLSLLVAAAVALPAAVSASGTYSARPPKPPTAKGKQESKVDAEKYELGKRIYNGKLKLSANPGTASAAQETRLRALQARLPEREQKSVNLPALAGKLSTEQLDALEYYANQRFAQK